MNLKRGSISELRQDLVSKGWVVVATGRARRPHDFKKTKDGFFKQPRSSCPFESPYPDSLSTHYLEMRGKTKWWVQVVKNKFPAFGKGGVCAVFRSVGPYQWTDGVGHHEVVISRDHTRSIAEMTNSEVEQIISAYRARYLALRNEDCVEYISIFHNHGRGAGASISHPHSQIIATPVIPPDLARSLEGSKKYFSEKRTCVHCVMIAYEKREKKRIIFENERFICFAPFASRIAFEMRVYPKIHQSQFELLGPLETKLMANVLRVSLAKLFKGLHDPDYNFFLHTSPANGGEDFAHYHWHFEILPKTSVWAGFEIGTGIDISTIAPESAAKFLSKIKITD